ncbi:hypothetical protein KIN20_032971 [Parelaphostrongylus tenuis]|uniref:Uncharacterized protein n=1 Tax=Parelaphostrongylus tenuis TaxID=148309 RepID=A0AAD5R7D1_PARTN|nr:hypothetical protein KIN20_032971 [Parelaphostrongylus tenuis]
MPLLGAACRGPEMQRKKKTDIRNNLLTAAGKLPLVDISIEGRNDISHRSRRNSHSDDMYGVDTIGKRGCYAAYLQSFTSRPNPVVKQ